MKKMIRSDLPALPLERRLTAAQFQALADVPPEAEWFANLGSAQTRRAYQNDIKSFMTFAGIEQPGEFRQVTRAHVIAWRRELERHRLAPSSIRRKLAALASLFEHLCESNAVSHNPVDGVKRPAVESYEGKTPIIGNREAAGLLVQPDAGTLKGLRDRALLSVMLFQGLRREEVARLRVKDLLAQEETKSQRTLLDYLAGSAILSIVVNDRSDDLLTLRFGDLANNLAVLTAPGFDRAPLQYTTSREESFPIFSGNQPRPTLSGHPRHRRRFPFDPLNESTRFTGSLHDEVAGSVGFLRRPTFLLSGRPGGTDRPSQYRQ